MKALLPIFLLLGFVGASAQSGYDPMEDLLSSAKKEIDAKGAIERSRDRAQNDPRKRKIDSGYWQFFQGKRDARSGEFCTALFWKADRMISILGPGGSNKGALLSFIAIDAQHGFPRLDDARATQKVRVTLKQGGDPPATVTGVHRSIGGSSDEISFAVQTVDAALAGLADRLRIRIDYEGKEVFDLEWHSGIAARNMLMRCLNGEDVNGKEAP